MASYPISRSSEILHNLRDYLIIYPEIFPRLMAKALNGRGATNSRVYGCCLLSLKIVVIPETIHSHCPFLIIELSSSVTCYGRVLI